MHSIIHRLTERIARFALFDEVRLIELYSALNLLAWAEFIYTAPAALSGGAYSGFDDLQPRQWLFVFGLTAILQLFATIRLTPWFYEVRLVAMAMASGAWTVVAVNFWLADFTTTANWNYTLLALACAVAGGFLGWKSTSFQS